jgi:ATP-dependent helicase/nuclease subunit B
MPERIFLGYDAPLLPLLVERLLCDREVLAESLVIVPTGQSGRILRESLAAAATSILAPAVTTPGALLHIDDVSVAPPWIEKIAWTEALTSIPAGAWENYADLFPVSPETGDGNPDWAVSLAAEITALRATLQEHRHNLFSASKFLASTPEAGRWENLARLETLAERQLSAWGYTSRTTALRERFTLPAGTGNIVLTGITEMPKCLEEALMAFDGKVVCLIAAPESERELFSPLGLPLETWASRELPPHVVTRIAADPAGQAALALAAVSETGAPSAEIALGCPDERSGAILARAFTENGWPAFHPASAQPMPPLVRWLTAWKDWLAKPTSRQLAALLSLPESAHLISGNRAQKLTALNRLRDQQAAIEPEAIVNFPEADAALRASISALLGQRRSFLSENFPSALTAHLKALDPKSESPLASRIGDFLAEAAPLFPQTARSHGFWLQTLLSWLPAPTAEPSADRVIDVQGWLELLFEPGAHLVICGMNETFVPSRPGGEPWLSENIRRALQLTAETDRHARDAYLLHAMLMMRRNAGSARLICGKTGAGGETLLPSRLLLRVPRAELVPTVENLFREMEPPEADLIWTRDWNWQPPAVDLPERIGVTALGDYLACPFRFYLKHLVGMRVPEPDRREMNTRDFGSITHLVVERWGGDAEKTRLTDPEKIAASLSATLDEVMRQEFGKNPPLAIRIQTHAIRQRLEWFAAVQADSTAEGWEIIEIESKFAIPSGAFDISGKIDRIDRHRETGQIRVIDYKTGKAENVEAAHRRKAPSVIPAHFPENGPMFQETTDAKGKAITCLWKNLQLPLYALARSLGSGETPLPAYIHLGKSRDEVKLNAWFGFSEADLESAKACMDWITGRLAERAFWPPSEKVKYDDFAVLSQNSPLAEAFSAPFPASSASGPTP